MDTPLRHNTPRLLALSVVAALALSACGGADSAAGTPSTTAAAPTAPSSAPTDDPTTTTTIVGTIDAGTTPETTDVPDTATTIPAATSTDTCLDGVWKLDNAQYQADFSNFLARTGGPTVTGVSGTVIIKFDGSDFSTEFSAWTVTLSLPGDVGQAQLQIDGTQAGTYAVELGVLSAAIAESSLNTTGSATVGDIEVDVADLPIPLEEMVRSNFFAEPVSYGCDADTLGLGVSADGTPDFFVAKFSRVD